METEKIKELLFLSKFDSLTEEESRVLSEFEMNNPILYEKLLNLANEEYNLIALSAVNPAESGVSRKMTQKVQDKVNREQKLMTDKTDKIALFPLYKYRFVAVYIIVILGVISAKFFIDASIAKESLTNYQAHLKYYQEIFADLDPREITIFDLERPGQYHSRKGSLIISNSGLKGLIASSSIEKIPDDKDYQLWVVKDETPINVGILNFNAEDSLFLNPVVDIPVAAVDEIDKIMITIEPKGGVTAPTGDEVLVGYPQIKDN